MSQALDSAKRLGMKYDEAVIIFYQGVLAKEDPARSQPLLKEAFNLFASFNVKFKNQL